MKDLLDPRTVTAARRSFETISDTLNTLQATADATHAIATHEAAAMAGDLHDIIRTATELRNAIVAKSIRPVASFPNRETVTAPAELHEATLSCGDTCEYTNRPPIGSYRMCIHCDARKRVVSYPANVDMSSIVGGRVSNSADHIS